MRNGESLLNFVYSPFKYSLFYFERGTAHTTTYKTDSTNLRKILLIIFKTVKARTSETSKEFLKCRLDNF